MSRPAREAGVGFVTAPGRGARRTIVRTLLLVLGVLVLAYGAATLAAREASEMHPTLKETWPGPPLVIAHQGGDGLWPSSTRYAYDRAMALGADVLEMDVHLSRDERLVVIHDDTVDRTTNGNGAVATLGVDDLAALDAGWSWSPVSEEGRTPYRGFGYGVPLLSEILSDHPGVPLEIEIKPEGEATATRLCRVLQESGRTGDAVVASFHEDAMRAFRTACPDVATAATPREVRRFLVASRLRVAGPYRPSFDALQVPVRLEGVEIVTPSFVRAAHAKGVQVHVWTIDDPEEMQRLLGLNVDGLITDRPDRALRVMGRPVPEGIVPPFVTP